MVAFRGDALYPTVQQYKFNSGPVAGYTVGFDLLPIFGGYYVSRLSAQVYDGSWYQVGQSGFMEEISEAQLQDPTFQAQLTAAATQAIQAMTAPPFGPGTYSSPTNNWPDETAYWGAQGAWVQQLFDYIRALVFDTSNGEPTSIVSVPIAFQSVADQFTAAYQAGNIKTKSDYKAFVAERNPTIPQNGGGLLAIQLRYYAAGAPSVIGMNYADFMAFLGQSDATFEATLPN